MKTKMKYTLDVTQENITRGRNIITCPISLALLDAGFDDVDVGDTYLSAVAPDNNIVIAKLHKTITNWIRNFDAGNTVQPFEIELELLNAIG